MVMGARGVRITQQCVEISTLSLSMLALTAVLVEEALVKKHQFAKTLIDLIHLVIIAHGTSPILAHVVILTMNSSRLLSIVVLVNQL